MDDLNKNDSNSAITRTSTEEKDKKDKQHKKRNTSSHDIHDIDDNVALWLMMNSTTE